MNKTLLLTLISILLSATAFASTEDYKLRKDTTKNKRKTVVTVGSSLEREGLSNKAKFIDNTFLGFEAGSAFSMGTNLNYARFWGRFRPAAGVSFGKWFSPSLGARTQFSFQQHRGQLLNKKRPYHFNSIALNLDGLVDFTQLINPKEYRKFSIIGMAGIVGGYTFGFSQRDWNSNNYYFDTDGKMFVGGLVGAIARKRITEKLSVDLEVSSVFTGNSFDGGHKGSGLDGYVNVMLGVVYHLKNSKGNHRPTFVMNKVNVYESKKTKPVVYNEEEALNKLEITDDKNRIQSTVRFTPDSIKLEPSEEKVVAEVARQMAENDNKLDVYVTTPDYNIENVYVFTSRANAVRNELVEKYNIPAGRVLIERSKIYIDTLDPEKKCFVIYVDDKK